MAFLKFSFLMGALFLNLTTSAVAQETNAEPLPTIEITDVYAFATMPGAATGAAFMIIRNTGDVDDRLISASSRVSKITEIHQNLIDSDDGKMMMRKIKGLDIPASGMVTLEPTGYHIMFIKMKEPLVMGGKAQFTLEFEKAGAQKVTAAIVAPGMKPTREKVMPWDDNEDVE